VTHESQPPVTNEIANEKKMRVYESEKERERESINSSYFFIADKRNKTKNKNYLCESFSLAIHWL
jgi:hypothetical protein